MIHPLLFGADMNLSNSSMTPFNTEFVFGSNTLDLTAIRRCQILVDPTSLNPMTE
jgi:hypothetical protein